MEKKEVAQNSTLEIPSDFEDWEEEKQIDFSRNSWIGINSQELIAEEGSPNVRKALAGNPCLDEEWQKYLYTTGGEDIKIELANNPSLSTSLQLSLAEEKHWRIRDSLARNKSISIDAINKLMLDEDNDVLSSLASNPNLEKDTQEALLNREIKEIWIGLAQNESISPEIDSCLCEKGDDEIFLAMAKKNGISFETQTHIIKSIPNSCENKALEALAKNPSLKIVYQRQLAENGCVHTKVALLQNTSLREKEKNAVLNNLDDSDMGILESELNFAKLMHESASERSDKSWDEYMKYDPNSFFGSYEKQNYLREDHDSDKEIENKLFRKVLDIEKKMEALKDALSQK